MTRDDLTDRAWSVIRPVPPNTPRGGPRAGDRHAPDGLFRVPRTSAPWRAVPEQYGPRTTRDNRFARWREAGVFDRIMDAVTEADDDGTRMIDSTAAGVHHHAARSRKATRIAARAARAATAT